jgi:AraC-like DNA-binding protein
MSTPVHVHHFPDYSNDLCSISCGLISQKVYRVIAYIDQYYFSQNIEVDRLASLVSTHPDHLSRKFRKETGLRLHDYLLRKRIQMSVLLLSDPAKNIKEISHEVGFSCPELYSKVFKRLMNCSPKTYRIQTSPINNTTPFQTYPS